MSEQTASEWYVLIDGEQLGPKPLHELQEMVRKGKLSPEGRVWAAGMEHWRQASDVPGLFKPPPFPPESVAPVPALAIPEAPPLVASRQDDPINESRDDNPIHPSEGLYQAHGRATFPEPQSGNYFVRHWRGDLSLGVSYWLNSFLANIASLAIFGAGLALITSRADEGLTFSFIILNVMLALFLVIAVWQIVGTWRSANKHPKRGGSHGWAVAAQIMLFLGVCRLMVDLGTNVTPVYLRMSELLFVEEPKKVFTVEHVPSQKSLVVVGEIKIGSAQILANALDLHPDVYSLVIQQSPGGWINEAEKAAKLVKAKGLVTVAAGPCLSACSLLFAAGEQRWVTREGRIGLHAPRNPVMGTTEDEDVRKMVGVLTAYGMPADMARRGASTPNSSMWYPTVAELKKSGFIRGTLDDDKFLKSGQLAVRSSSDDVKASLIALPVYAALNKADPSGFSAIAKALTEFVDSGSGDLEQGIARIKPLFLKSIYKFVPISAAETVIDLARVNLGYIERLQRDNVSGCVALSDPSKRPPMNVNLTMYKDLASREMDLYARAASEGSRNPARVPSEADVSADYEAIGAALQRKAPGKLALSQKAEIEDTELKDYCELQVLFLREVVNAPRERAERVLRQMYSGLWQ